MAAVSELDFALASFWEFARIWRSGKKCKLVLNCDGGVGELHLVAGLGAAEERHFPPQDFKQQQRKKTPSQLRREERRRKERESKQVEAEVEAVEVSEEAENIMNNEHNNAEKADVIENQTSRVAGIDATEVTDEVCPDDVYHEEEIDPAEAARDKMVEKIIIYPVTKKWKVDKNAIENEIKDKLNLMQVNVKNIETKRTIFGEFNGSIVETSPVNLNKVWGRRLGVTNCAIISFDP